MIVDRMIFLSFQKVKFSEKNKSLMWKTKLLLNYYLDFNSYSHCLAVLDLIRFWTYFNLESWENLKISSCWNL